MSMFTLIAYRPNGADYCMGCLMGATDSDLKVFCLNDKDEVIKHWADLLVEDYEADTAHAPREITLLINNVVAVGDVEKALSSFPESIADEIYAQAAQLEKDATTLAGELIKKRIAEKAKEKLAEAELAKEAQRQRDLAELARLQTKLNMTQE